MFTHKPVQTYIIYALCISLFIRCLRPFYCVYFVSNQMKIEQTLPVVFIIIYYQYWDHPNSIAPLQCAEVAQTTESLSRILYIICGLICNNSCLSEKNLLFSHLGIDFHAIHFQNQIYYLCSFANGDNCFFCLIFDIISVCELWIMVDVIPNAIFT